MNTCIKIWLALTAMLLAYSNHVRADFSISGTQLLDGHGQPFVMRGVNHPHTWYSQQTSSFADIAATGANTVRVVLSNGERWNRNSASDVNNVIQLCKNNKLICVLEVHDATGGGEEAAAASIASAAQYWIDIASVLVGQEDYVIINIANEPVGNYQPAALWIDQHRQAIQRMRAAGLRHTLIVDAPSWGQDWEEVMLNRAGEVANADPQQNTLFSVHMYQVYQDFNRIDNYVSRFLSEHNLPLIIGEFGADHQGAEVDEDSIMAVAQQYQIGYLGWSWSGNGDCCGSLDLVYNFDPKRLTSWGERLIHGTDGLKETACPATVYAAACGEVANPQPDPIDETDNVDNTIDDSADNTVDETNNETQAPATCSGFGWRYWFCLWRS